MLTFKNWPVVAVNEATYVEVTEMPVEQFPNMRTRGFDPVAHGNGRSSIAHSTKIVDTMVLPSRSRSRCAF